MPPKAYGVHSTFNVWIFIPLSCESEAALSLPQRETSQHPSQGKTNLIALRYLLFIKNNLKIFSFHRSTNCK